MLAAFPRAVMGQDVAGAMHALATADAVCFDVDSTVIQEEGIDVLAAYLGKGEQVAALTATAMEGGMKFQDALSARLDLLRPTKQQILDCLEQHPFQLTPKVQELIRTLQSVNKDVYLVSGGFRIMIEPVAAKLHIPVGNIVANTILFDAATGAYTGFDAAEPTSQDMGKPRALRQIQQQLQLQLQNGTAYSTMVMIGDGATDAQAKPPAQTFIGFGGVAVRDKVKLCADWFVTDFDDLLHILEHYSSSSTNKK
jgi:phosphoserine phosphatase